MPNLEQPTSSSHIAAVNFSQRKDFIKENAKDFPELWISDYRWTGTQNIALLNFLRTNPISTDWKTKFREQWEAELMSVKNEEKKEKKGIINAIRGFIQHIVDKDKPKFAPKSAQEFLWSTGVSEFPAWMRNNNPFNIKWTNSDFQKRILVDPIEPSKNKDQWNRQVVFKSPEAGMASWIRLLLHRYNYNELKTVNDLIAHTSLGWTQDGTKTNKLWTNAAKEIAQRMGIGVNNAKAFNLNDRAVLSSFIKELLYQEHWYKSGSYSNMITPVVNMTV